VLFGKLKVVFLEGGQGSGLGPFGGKSSRWHP
jgi:hypothetical protein